jgi:alanine-synthesizing transaminase
MFSSRTDWDLRPSPLFHLLQQKRSKGEEIIDLTESNPTHCGFADETNSLIDPDSLRRSALYEPDPKGLLSARESIARWYEKQHLLVDPSRIVLTSSTSEAYSFLFRLLCNPGDGVAVPKPSYPLFEYLSRLNDVRCQHYRLAYDGEWHMDMRSVEESLSPGARALVLVHPNNPTGSYIKTEERVRLIAMLERHHLPLIVDEVFHSFPFGGDERRAAGFAAEQGILTFIVNGLSKLIGLPQMKLAWIVVSGPGELCSKAIERLEVISDTYLSVGTPAQHALGSLLSDPSGLGKRILARVKGNYGALSHVFSSGSPVTLFRCEGGWNAVLRLPSTRSDEDWAQVFLQMDGVLTHPGHLFDFELPSCVVLSLLPEPEHFLEGTKRLAASVTR